MLYNYIEQFSAFFFTNHEPTTHIVAKTQLALNFPLQESHKCGQDVLLKHKVRCWSNIILFYVSKPMDYYQDEDGP